MAFNNNNINSKNRDIPCVPPGEQPLTGGQTNPTLTPSSNPAIQGIAQSALSDPRTGDTRPVTGSTTPVAGAIDLTDTLGRLAVEAPTARAPATREEFEENLKDWVLNGRVETNLPNRQAAAKSIRLAYYQDNDELHLNDNQL